MDQVARRRIAVKKTLLHAYFTKLKNGVEKCQELGQSGVLPGAAELDCAFKGIRDRKSVV